MSGSHKFPMSSNDLNSETIEMNVKEEITSKEDGLGEQSIPDYPDVLQTQTTSIYHLIPDMGIKHEEMDLHTNSTADAYTEDDSELKTVFSIQLLDSSSVMSQENDLKEFYDDLLQCENNCETCVKYLRILSEHVRTNHAPPQPIQDPLLIHPDPPQAYQSSSVQIQRDIDKMGCSVEVPLSNCESDPDYNIEDDSESDPDYDPSPSVLQQLRPRGQSSVIKHTSSEILTSRGNFNCKVCGKSCRSLAHLKGHNRSHTGEKPFKCDKCDKSFSLRGNLTVHQRTHTGERPYECDRCEKSYKTTTHLRDHIRSHTGEKPFKCVTCDKSFSTTGHLFSHKRTHTKTTGKSKSFRSDPDYNIEDVSESDPDYDTPHQSSITPQLRPLGQGSVKNHTSSEIFTLRDYYNCKVCDKSFNGMADLKVHKRTHTGEKQFKCGTCDKSFAMRGNLTVHQRTHTGEKPFACDHCNNSFRTSTHLRDHKKTHTGEKPFKCDVCEKSFARSYSLTIHKRIHTTDEPFKCKVCMKSFSTRCYLNEHKKIHTHASTITM